MYLTRKLKLTLFTLLVVGFTLSILPRMQTVHADPTLTYMVTDIAPGNSTYDETGAQGMNPSGHVVGYDYPFDSGTMHTFVYNSTGFHDLDDLLTSPHMQFAPGTPYFVGTNLLVNGGIENSGMAVGTFWTDDYSQQRVALYDPATGMHDIGTLGGDYAAPYAVNASGQVVGYSRTTNSGETHAFLYSGGVMQDLDTLGCIDSAAYAINSSGQAVGWAYTANEEGRAMLYDSTGMHDLGTLGGANSGAYDINDSGQIVGYAENANNERRAMLYDSTGMHDLGFAGEALAINNAGQIVGYSYNDGAFLYDSNGVHYLNFGYGGGVIDRFTESGVVTGTATGANYYQHAFLYDSNGMHSMTLSGGESSEIRAINSSGQVVGYSIATTGEQYAVLYDGTSLVNLTPDNVFSRATAINGSGDVVGFTETPNNESFVFLYHDGVLINLNALITDEGVELYDAVGISDTGQILINGLNNEQYRALLLTPGS
jgi:probable HAF family extracellular repeat protein